MSVNSYNSALVNLISTSRLSLNGQTQTIGKQVTKESLDAIINQASIERSRNNFLTIMSNRINAFAKGQIQPKEDWELMASYLSKTGQPMIVSISEDGKPEITRLRDSDLSKFNTVQKDKLTKALDQLDQLIVKQNANMVNQGLRYKLEDAAASLSKITLGKQLATEQWQIQAKSMMANLTPMKLGLTADGEVVASDQTKSALLDTPPEKRERLREVIGQWQAAAESGIYMEMWQVEAKVLNDQGKSFYFELDAGGQPVVKENTPENIVPSFLKEDPYPNLGANQKWQKDALAFAAQGTPFMLDIDMTGQVVARQINAQNVINFAKPPFYQQQNVGAVVSLLT